MTARMTMIPVAHLDGSLSYFWEIVDRNVINVGHCNEGSDISAIYDEFKAKLGYIEMRTTKILEEV
jgi:hypothetical protein